MLWMLPVMFRIHAKIMKEWCNLTFEFRVAEYFEVFCIVCVFPYDNNITKFEPNRNRTANVVLFIGFMEK